MNNLFCIFSLVVNGSRCVPVETMKHDAGLFGEVVGAVVERIQDEIQGIESGCVRGILYEIRIQLLCKM